MYVYPNPKYTTKISRDLLTCMFGDVVSTVGS